MEKSTFLAFLAVANLCFGAKLPTTFKKCDKKQSDFDQCLSTAVKDALSQLNVEKKEVGLPSFEPLEVPSLAIGAGTGPVQFSQNYKDFKLSGFTKVDSLKANRMDFEKKILELDIDFPEIVMNFEYKFKGRILVLPIEGEGPGRINLHKPKFLLNLHLEEYEKKNKKYYKVTQKKLLVEPQMLNFKLDNLFNGDKVLGDNINRVMNDNSKEMYADLRSSYEEAFGKIFVAVFDNLLTRVPIAQLFASTFKKCDKKQSDFDQCLSTAVKDALSQLNIGKKEVGLPSFEPLEVPSLVIGAGTGPVGFVQNYKNIKLSGFTKVDSLKAK
ncbi:hypothetical protein GEV33_000855 [Tenebrio molitor]|uniref:Hemolymph juvenile hormone binding protein n=1 Tax=Tenebrio molitor TaxID=7067 RepID=A0A8J6HYC1_TENMO|nr:hypothetical protein GEV33_000855 [Tenebrio molitor]